MSRRTEIEVGVTVLVALGVVLWGVTWLKDMRLSSRVNVWHVRFPQTGGLGTSDPVQVNGIPKGAVNQIELQGNRVLVDVGLATDVKLSTNSRIAIRNVGLMGEKVIAVDLGEPGPPRAPRDTIEGTYELGIPEVVAGLGGTFTAVDNLTTQLAAIASDVHHSGDLHAALVNLHETSTELRDAVQENRKVLKETLADAQVASRAARELTAGRADQYHRLIDATERTTHHLELLSARLDTLSATAQSLGNRLDHGDGTAAHLINDRQLYDESRTTLKTMRDLLEDIKAHPRKYINVHVF